MLFPFLLSLWAILTVEAISCPPGYSDNGDGSCYGGPYFFIDRNSAYFYCSQYGAYLYDVINAFQNTDVQNRAIKYDYLWLGLTCLSNSTSSCVWDSGMALTRTSYTNFDTTGINITAGACVRMDVKTGLWYSADCSNGQAYYGCKYTPSVTVPRCLPSSTKTATFRGKCYFPIPATSLADAITSCSRSCGTVTSIHSDGEDSFVRNLAYSFNHDNAYMFTGLELNGGYSWQDGSFVNYLNFGYENTGLGTCVSMATRDDFVKSGKWINSQCDGNLVAVCQKPVDNACDRTTTIPPTTSSSLMAPIICGDPAVYQGVGTLYSPGYPLTSVANSCEYLIVEDPNQRALIQFADGQLNYNGYIYLYSSFLAASPYKTYTNVNLASIISQSPTNIIKLVYNTTGYSSNSNYWSLQYSGF